MPVGDGRGEAGNAPAVAETGGIELTGRVPSLAAVAAIFVSGYGKDASLAGALRIGAGAPGVKPLSPIWPTARSGAALRSRSGSMGERRPRGARQSATASNGQAWSALQSR